MYHSWWFRLLLVLLTLNLVICSIERLTATGKIIFSRHPKVNPDQFRKRKLKEQFTVKRPAGELEDAYRNILTKMFSRQVSGKTPNGFYLYGEKGRLTRLGVYIVHFSIVLLIAGGLVGSFFGFEGYVNIPEGESTDIVFIRKTGVEHKLPFAIRCNDFNLTTYANGAPAEFRSSLTLLQGEQELVNRDIIVNDPLRYMGINIFQSSYGEMKAEMPHAAMVTARKTGDELELAFLSKASGMTYQRTVAIGTPVDIPEGLGSFLVSGYTEAATFRGVDIGNAYEGTYTPVEGDPVPVLLPLRFPRFDRMRGGEVVITVIPPEGAAAARPAEKRYYTGLQVTRDPGIWIVYAGFMLMIMGCFVTFFMSHQQVCIEVIEQDGRSRVIVSGTANKNRIAMRNRLEDLAGRLSAS
jgi:cytochrome c biogenesis protein